MGGEDFRTYVNMAFLYHSDHFVAIRRLNVVPNLVLWLKQFICFGGEVINVFKFSNKISKALKTYGNH